MRKLGWGLWWLCLAFVLGTAGWVAYGVYDVASSDDPLNTIHAVDCDEALRFAGASLPEGAAEEDCTSYSWMEQAYTGTFRMPRAAVPGWLATSFPGAEPPASCEEDACVIVRNDPAAESTTGAYDVSVGVRYEGGSAGDTALVTFDASTY